jgi:hypothetical protein
MADWSTDDIEFIKRHTSYESDELIIEKLTLYGTPINVVKESFNIPKHSNTNNNGQITTPSLNQEIYRQLRNKMERSNTNIK